MDDSEFDRGARLFNHGDFFDAHEVWEDVWRSAPAEEKRFLQGLIQVAVALHHHRQGNLDGARSLLARAQRNLATYADAYNGVDLMAVRNSVRVFEKALSEGQALPRIHITRFN